MNLEEFEVDGQKFLINNKIGDDETGIAINNEEKLEKTQEVEIISDEELLGKTLTDIFGEENE